jgi:hypothetical protein
MTIVGVWIAGMVVCAFALGLYAWTEFMWQPGSELTLADVLLCFVIILLPVINLIVGVILLWFLLDQHGRRVVILRGRLPSADIDQ